MPPSHTTSWDLTTPRLTEPAQAAVRLGGQSAEIPPAFAAVSVAAFSAQAIRARWFYDGPSSPPGGNSAGRRGRSDLRGRSAERSISTKRLHAGDSERY